jgi:hypothetical protein
MIKKNKASLALLLNITTFLTVNGILNRIPGSTIGYGYDIIFGNPYLSVDPGVRASPLNLTYMSNLTTDDGWYIIPDQV